MATNKDVSLYFPHDADARNDDKMIRLRMRHGAAGYGVYFMILERLRAEREYMSVKDYNMIAFDLRVDAAMIKSVVEDFGLFVFTENGKYFYSDSFNRRMEVKDNISRKRKEAVSKRWNGKKGIDNTDDAGNNNTVQDSNVLQKNQKTDTNVIQMYSETDSNVLQKNQKTDTIKIKEKKRNNNKKISTEVDIKKEDLAVSDTTSDGDFEKDFPSGISDTLSDVLRRFLTLVPLLSRDNPYPASKLRETAFKIVETWNFTGEYSRKDPVCHLRNTVLKVLRGQSSAAHQKASPVVSNTEKEDQRKELDQIYERDSAAELQAYLRSKGLDPDTPLVTMVTK